MSYEFFYRLRDELAFFSYNIIVFKSSDPFYQHVYGILFKLIKIII